MSKGSGFLNPKTGQQSKPDLDTLLFEICYELVHNGKPGRPKKTFKRGVHFRIKNKGSQAHKKGRKRLKYQSSWREHPDTARTIAETDIHANHTEAFWSALRRKCATFRRKTNMYAKATTGLQRLLRVYWVVHNFLRVHFTTREVPAVALGLLGRVCKLCFGLYISYYE